MDVYVLNELREREHIVDRFESWIWTERFAAYGDFELYLRSIQRFRDMFVEGTWLVQNNSYRVMVVDSVEDAEDESGKMTLKVSGKSLEAVLMDRIAARDYEQLRTNTKWTVTNTPGQILRDLFRRICIEGALDKRDIIPNVTLNTHRLLPQGNRKDIFRDIRQKDPRSAICSGSAKEQ